MLGTWKLTTEVHACQLGSSAYVRQTPVLLCEPLSVRSEAPACPRRADSHKSTWQGCRGHHLGRLQVTRFRGTDFIWGPCMEIGRWLGWNTYHVSSKQVVVRHQQEPCHLSTRVSAGSIRPQLSTRRARSPKEQKQKSVASNSTKMLCFTDFTRRVSSRRLVGETKPRPAVIPYTAIQLYGPLSLFVIPADSVKVALQVLAYRTYTNL